MRNSYWVWLMVLLAFSLAGCGESGPKRSRLSGSVLLDGKAIPYGEIIITPDASKKNSGAQGRATIRDGQYDTSSEGCLGGSGGAVILRVNGMTGPGGKTLCEYEIALDWPSGDLQKDINVPLKEAFNGNPKGGSQGADF